MLKDLGVSFVLVGHSERRHVFGESDGVIAGKMKAALRHDLLPVLCVGETLQEREDGQTLAVVERQLTTALDGLEIKRLIVAYEPVWAIGTGKTATPEQAVEVHESIRGCLSRLLGQDFATNTSIAYGGSVKPDNAADLLAREAIDGALIGGASLKSESFAAIAEPAS